MIQFMWSAIAVLAGLLVGGIVSRWVAPLISRRTRPADPAAEAGVTPLQTLARRVLAAFGVLSLLYFGVIFSLWPRDDPAGETQFRLAGELAVVGMLVVSLVTFVVAKNWIRKGRLIIDERDEQVLAGAPVAQVFAMFVCLSVWVIVLSEIYWDAGQVPVAMLSTILYSTLLVTVLALPIGILLGYSTRAR